MDGYVKRCLPQAEVPGGRKVVSENEGIANSTALRVPASVKSHDSNNESGSLGRLGNKRKVYLWARVFSAARCVGPLARQPYRLPVKISSHIKINPGNALLPIMNSI